MPYIEAVRVDQLGELLWVSKVLLLALERINKNIDFSLYKCKELIAIELISKQFVFHLFALHQLRAKKFTSILFLSGQ